MSAQVVSVEEIADVKLGRQRSPKNHDGPNMRKYLRAANVGWSGLLLDDVKTMNFTDAEMAQFRLEPGDILLNEASGSPREVGKPAIWQGEIDECAFQNTLLRVRPQGDVDPRYLLHFFRHEAESGAFVRGARGTGIHHLGRAALAKWEVPLPPIEEQRRIAAILDHADALRAKRREALAGLDELGDSVYADMFADTLCHSRQVRLDEVSEIVSGITKGRKVNGAPLRTVPYLAVANVQDKKLDLRAVKTIEATDAEIARWLLQCDDLLITEGGDPDKLGRGSLWREELPEAIHQNHVFRVRPDTSQVDPIYLNWTIGSRRGKAYFLRSAKQTTGIASINSTQLKAFPLELPPKDVQEMFAQRVRAIDSMRDDHRTALAELDALFASLQSRAFRGDL